MKRILICGLMASLAGLAGTKCLAQPVKMPPKGTGPVVQAADPEQDCLNALVICDNLYFQPNSYSGEGLLPNEINPLISCLSAGERNDVWYSVKVVSGGLLNFTITPVNPTDDYDWAVFNLTQAECSDIAVNAQLQVSCNFSANVGCGGQTGANGNTAGLCGMQNNPALAVIAGERYVINVSNFSATQSGYTIDFSPSTAVIFDNSPPTGLNAMAGCSQQLLEVVLNEPLDCKTFSNPVTEIGVQDAFGNNLAVKSVTVVCGQGPANAKLKIELAQPMAQTGILTVVPVIGTDNNTFSDRCGNFVTAGQALATITVVNDISVNLGADVSQCPADVRPLLSVPALPGATYAWTLNGLPLGGSQPQLQINLPGVYGVTVSTGPGCEASDTMNFLLLPAPEVDLGNDTALCHGMTMPSLNAGTGGTAYTWSLNGTTLPVSAAQWQPVLAGTYSVTVTGTVCKTTDDISLTIYDPVVVGFFQNEISLCEGEQVQLFNPDPSLSYVWHLERELIHDNPQVSYSALPGILKTGWQYLTATDSNHCSVVDSILVTAMQQPGRPDVQCPVFSSAGFDFTWSPVEGAEWYEVSGDQGLTWQLPTSGNGGLSHTDTKAQLWIRAMSNGNCLPGEPVETVPCVATIPTAISPNNDGHNDFLRIENTGNAGKIGLMIFNRYGKRVFVSANYQNDWSAEGLPSGTYFYVLETGESGFLKGFITVAR